MSRVKAGCLTAARRRSGAGGSARRPVLDVARELGNMKGAMMKLGQMASYLDSGLPEPDALKGLFQLAWAGRVTNDALAGIEEQIKREVGDGWKSDDRVLRGRNAVRREHGLPGLGEPGDRPSPATDPVRPLWRRLFGR